MAIGIDCPGASTAYPFSPAVIIQLAISAGARYKAAERVAGEADFMQTAKPEVPEVCTLHDWEGLRTQLLFAFDRPISGGKADGTYFRRGQYGAVLVRSGEIQVEAAGERVHIRPGQWVFCLAEHVSHRLSHDAHVLAVRMSNTWADETRFFTGTRKLVVLDAAEHPEIEALAMQLVAGLGEVAVYRENPVYTYRHRTRLDLLAFARHQQFLMDWLVLVANLMRPHGWSIRLPRGLDSRLASTLDIIDDLPLSAPLPRRKVEGASGLTLQQLDRLCRESFEMTVRQYWDRRRLRYAQFELRNPATSIKEIATRLCFVQLSHFSKWFKRHTRLSPRSYQNSQRNEPSP